MRAVTEGQRCVRINEQLDGVIKPYLAEKWMRLLGGQWTLEGCENTCGVLVVCVDTSAARARVSCVDWSVQDFASLCGVPPRCIYPAETMWLMVVRDWVRLHAMRGTLLPRVSAMCAT